MENQSGRAVLEEAQNRAQALFDGVTHRSLTAYRLTMSLLEFARVGVPSAHEHFVDKFSDAIKELIARPTFGSDEDRAKARQRLPKDAHNGAESAVQDAITTADAACFVFMHSMLDCSVDDYCEITALLSPEGWRSCVTGEKITLAQASGDHDALLRNLVERYVKSLKNQSLPNRIASLLSVCKPGGAEILAGYTYDPTRMKKLDDLRHDLVHKQICGIDDVLDDLLFFDRTQVYLSTLITYRFGLMLGPNSMPSPTSVG